MRHWLDKCPCGSDEGGQAVFDNHGIFVFYSCSKCDKKQREKYDPIIFDDYDAYEEKVAAHGERFEDDY
jgi:hypothetical protein